MYNKGQVVFSKRGRDKGNCFIIVDYDDEYLYLADGDLRKLNKPKKKKKKHAQIVNFVFDDLKEKLEKGLYLLDSDVRAALKAYENL